MPDNRLQYNIETAADTRGIEKAATALRGLTKEQEKAAKEVEKAAKAAEKLERQFAERLTQGVVAFGVALLGLRQTFQALGNTQVFQSLQGSIRSFHESLAQFITRQPVIRGALGAITDAFENMAGAMSNATSRSLPDFVRRSEDMADATHRMRDAASGLNEELQQLHENTQQEIEDLREGAQEQTREVELRRQRAQAALAERQQRTPQERAAAIAQIDRRRLPFPDRQRAIADLDRTPLTPVERERARAAIDREAAASTSHIQTGASHDEAARLRNLADLTRRGGNRGFDDPPDREQLFQRVAAFETAERERNRIRNQFNSLGQRQIDIGRRLEFLRSQGATSGEEFTSLESELAGIGQRIEAARQAHRASAANADRAARELPPSVRNRADAERFVSAAEATAAETRRNAEVRATQLERQAGQVERRGRRGGQEALFIAGTAAIESRTALREAEQDQLRSELQRLEREIVARGQATRQVVTLLHQAIEQGGITRAELNTLQAQFRNSGTRGQ